MSEGAPTAPTPFGKYLLDREIARGGMARVWLARLRGHGGFEKRLVVKQILAHLADDPRFVALFVEEAKTLVALSHPHIVPVYELGVVEGTWFLAMEHVEGATLAAILEAGALEAESVAHLGVQLSDALSYAHDRFHLVHRDVTPRNVIVERTGHARLLDFGIAARATPVGEAGTGAVYGTPGYVSPEQARGEAIDARSDLFSLGCVLFEALAGAPAFARDDLEAVRALRAEDVPALPESLGELATVVRRCLEPSPARRPASARELGRTLRAWLNARDVDDPGHALTARVEAARVAAARPAPDGDADPAMTPGTARVADRSLATSRLLDEIVEPSASGRAKPAAGRQEAAADEAGGPGTVRLDRPRASDPAGASDAAPPGGASATSPSARDGRARLATAVFTVIGGALTIALVSTAGYDPPTADPRRSETDVDGTMWIEPADGDLVDAGGEITGAAEIVGSGARPPAGDAGAGRSVDSAIPRAGDAANAGARARAGSATLRVTSDGNAAIEIDGHALGHAPIRETTISTGTHTVSADCVALGRTGTAAFRAAAGAAVRARVNCTADPVTVVVAGGE